MEINNSYINSIGRAKKLIGKNFGSDVPIEQIISEWEKDERKNNWL